MTGKDPLYVRVDMPYILVPDDNIEVNKYALVHEAMRVDDPISLHIALDTSIATELVWVAYL